MPNETNKTHSQLRYKICDRTWWPESLHMAQELNDAQHRKI